MVGVAIIVVIVKMLVLSALVGTHVECNCTVSLCAVIICIVYSDPITGHLPTLHLTCVNTDITSRPFGPYTAFPISMVLSANDTATI